MINREREFEMLRMKAIEDSHVFTTTIQQLTFNEMKNTQNHDRLNELYNCMVRSSLALLDCINQSTYVQLVKEGT
jgi:hypothetical protein